MICAIFMICILLLSVTFVMYFNERNKDIYLLFICLFDIDNNNVADLKCVNFNKEWPSSC